MSDECNIKKEFTEKNDIKYKVTTYEPINYQFGTMYSFNVGFAQKYGINEAIILNNLIFWIKKNKANNVNFYDGYYWTYNSAKAFKELFPFWTERQIRYILKSLEDKNIIKTGNYNKVKYDKTCWYTIIDESLLQICNMGVTKVSQESDENVTPIPDINTDNKLYINDTSKKAVYEDNVKLTEKEYNKLTAKYGNENTLFLIRYLSNYKKEKGYKTKSDYLTILRWVVEACQKRAEWITQDSCAEYKKHEYKSLLEE